MPARFSAMEVFLLLLDEIDDAIAMLRSLWPRVLVLALGFSLSLATGFALLQSPRLALPLTALLLSAMLVDHIRRRRLAGTSG